MNYTGNVRITNCILRGHVPDVFYSVTQVSYSNIDGGWPGEGNIDADPCFVDASSGDYHLLADSPCVDAADPNYDALFGETDIDGQPRVIGARIDMGADETSYEYSVFHVSQTKVRFEMYEGAVNPEPQVLSIRNSGGIPLNWSITHDCSWLDVDPNTGNSMGEPDEVTLSVETTGLATGRYDCELQISDANAANNPQVVNVSLVILGPIIELSDTRIQFFAEQGSQNPKERVLSIRNIGGGLLNWEVTEDCPWLEVDPDSGSSMGDANEVTITMDITGLREGFHDCTLSISDPVAANSPQTVWVCLFIDTEDTLVVPVEYPNVQVAVDAAVPSATVVVVPGTCAGQGNRDIDLRGKAIVVRGARPNDPNVVAATVIDCEEKGRGFYLNGCSGATIAGLTITNGYSQTGGGVYLENTTANIAYCQITNNATSDGGLLPEPGDPSSQYPGPGGNGGGICCTSSSLMVRDCTITGNRTGTGRWGVFYAYTGGPGGCGGDVCCVDSSSLVICDSEISENRAGEGGDYGGDGGDGGGVYCSEDSSLEVSESIVCGNIAGNGGISEHGGGRGGAGGGLWAGSVELRGCLIADNKAGKGGAGFRFKAGGEGGYGGGVYCAELSGMHCQIVANRSGNGGGSDWEHSGGDAGRGGGIYCATANLTDCLISDNRTGNGADAGDAGNGGDGAGVHCNSGAISNCLISANTTGSGGSGESSSGAGGSGAGVYLGSPTPSSIRHCTIVENSTGDGGQRQWDGTHGARGTGGGVYGGGGTVIIDSIIWGNSPEQLFGHDCNNVSFCDIGGDECIGRVGNISADPLFVQPGYWANTNDPNIVVEPNDANAVWIMGDYHLSQKATGQVVDSPCVDAGSDLAVNLGMHRYTTRTDQAVDAGIVDMGYHHPIPTLGDIDGDGDVDLVDYAIFAGHWSQLVTMEIPMGEVVVDGDISEWSDGVEWIALDKVYYGNPDDVSEAQYALRWNPETDKIYVAVIVNDGDHVFSDEYIKWNASDRMEIYSQGDAEGGTGWLGTYDVAQQYMMGPNNSGGSWLSWALGEVLEEDVGLEYAVTVNGSQIIHEAGVLMFDNYGGFSGGDTIVTELAVGHVVGFDILASSRWGADGFGMLSENLMTGKSGDADDFGLYTLVEQLSRSPYAPDAADLDKSGVVDCSDLALLADNWLWQD